jgi:hypothetical protein
MVSAEATGLASGVTDDGKGNTAVTTIRFHEEALWRFMVCNGLLLDQPLS